MKIKAIAAVMLVVAGLAAPASAGSLDFEDLMLGASYNSGDSFVTSGVTVTAKDFTWSSGITTNAGFAEVENGGLAGGSGNELEVNNILLDFALGNVKKLGFAFGEYGGNLNIRVNGSFLNFEDFADIDGMTIGGAMVSITNGFGNDQGVATLMGPISGFAIGGQELYIDNLRTVSAVPLPASALLLGGGLMGLMGLRRRKKTSS